MPEDLTFQDLLEEFQEDIFVGRTEQLTLFENALTAPRLPFLILAVSGQGGVGKTTLLEQYHRRAAAHEALTAMVNEYQKTVPAVLACLAEKLEDVGGDFKRFNERYRKYRELQEQVEADPQAPKGMLDFAFRSATRIGLRALRRVPIAGEAAAVLFTDEVEDRVVDETSALAAYVARKFTNRDERVLLLETDAELTRHFVTDLNALLKKHRVTLCFDTYEETASALDTWLRDLLSGKYGKFGGRVLFVIAGRYPLSQAWTGYRKAIRQIELNPFTEEEAREYLHSAGITAEDQIAQLIDLSERLPVLLAFLVSAPGDVPVDVTGTAVERFLQSASSEQREAALLAAVPRYFNRDILAVVLGEQVSPATFDWLSNAHFVRPKSDGWRYHDVVRHLILDYLHRRSPQEYRALHARLSAYHYAQIGDPDTPPRYDDSMWRFHRLEALYHDLMQATHAACVKSIEALLLSIFPSDDMSLAEGIALVWQQAAAEQRSSNTVTEWWGVFATMGENYDKGKQRNVVFAFLQKVIALDDLSSVALSKAYFLLGIFQIDSKNYEQALVDLTRAIELQPENGGNYIGRGLAYYRLQNYPAAHTDLTRAIELQPEDGGNCHWRGRTSYEQQNYPAALADFTRAIQLQPENAFNYYWRGMTCYRQQDYPAALADLTRAIDLQPEAGGNYYWRGRTHYELNDYPAVLADLTRAIELRPENVNNYAWRGRTYYEQQDYPAALADFSRAIELQPENVYNYAWRARTYYEQQDYPTALTDLTHAIELQPENGGNYYWRGMTYYRQQDYPAALTDLTRAIELRPENGDNYLGRGLTYFQQQDYPAALADFTRAIELQPENVFNYLGRSKIHFQQQDYPAALVDFTCAIELQPENSDNYLGRGLTYFQQQDYPAALADFTRAIELQPENGDNHMLRSLTYYEQQDYPAALADLTRAIELQPEDAFNYARRGIVHLDSGNIEEAEQDFAQAKALLQDDGEPMYIIAAAYARQELPEPACAFLRLAIEHNHKFLEQALTDTDFDPIRAAPCFQALILPA